MPLSLFQYLARTYHILANIGPLGIVRVIVQIVHTGVVAMLCSRVKAYIRAGIIFGREIVMNDETHDMYVPCIAGGDESLQERLHGSFINLVGKELHYRKLSLFQLKIKLSCAHTLSQP